MNIVFFSHPKFLKSQSMPRFAAMLCEGMQERGHNVVQWTPSACFFKIPTPEGFRKWLGYVDQYFWFPLIVANRLRKCPEDTLFVFTDNALGPWVPLVRNRPHVIHCHDFLAQKSALGEIQVNPTGWTGRFYQKFIRWGYSKGRNFISVSKNTKADLHRFLAFAPHNSKVVYNGLNQSFSPMDTDEARRHLEEETGIYLKDGFFLHVGGNDWYKNRIGVIEVYSAWRTNSEGRNPLLLIGSPPDRKIKADHSLSAYRSDIHFLTGMGDEFVRMAYCGANALLFPSLEEGFGWPIVEAMASGCPVITTDEAPMTEIGGNAAYYIPKRPFDKLSSAAWAREGAKMLERVLALSSHELDEVKKISLENSRRFDPGTFLDKIERIYSCVLLCQKR